MTLHRGCQSSDTGDNYGAVQSRQIISCLLSREAERHQPLTVPPAPGFSANFSPCTNILMYLEVPASSSSPSALLHPTHRALFPESIRSWMSL